MKEFDKVWRKNEREKIRERKRETKMRRKAFDE